MVNLINIIDGIYISNYDIALDNRTLRHNNIKAVFNCTNKNSIP